MGEVNMAWTTEEKTWGALAFLSVLGVGVLVGFYIIPRPDTDFEALVLPPCETDVY